MSNASRNCPHCPRSAGRHTDKCPRSRRSLRVMNGRLDRVPRRVWPGKYEQFSFAVKEPSRFAPLTRGRRMVERIYTAFNPGVPMTVPPHAWNRGGLPRGPLTDPKSPVHGDKRILAETFKREFIDRVRPS